jgi:hypothetical protein
VHEDDLVVATFGRSFWVLDDVTPLRQIESQMAAASSWLFRPGVAYRVRPGYDQGTPVQTDEPMGVNPPDGAALDYYLKEKAAGPVQLEILDSQGKLVRRFASNDELRKIDPREVAFPIHWLREPQSLSAEVGMHRFVWDLRYSPPKGARASFRGSSAPWALPGNYIVKLTANGKSSTQSLTVKMDPRVKTSQEELVRQFELSSRLAGRLSEVSAAMQQTRELRKQVDSRKKEASGNAELQQALEALEKKIEVAVEPDSDDDFMLFGLGVPSKEHEPLPKSATALTALLIIVESVDAAPTADAAMSSEKWNASAQETLARWTAVKKEDLVSVNALLQKAKLMALTVDEPPAAN